MEFVAPRRVASLLSLVAVLGLIEARPALAQDGNEAPLPRTEFALPETAAFEAWPIEQTNTRPAPLMSLYVTFAALQALDVASTRMALRAGGRETNPLVAPVAGSPVALTAVKAGAAGAIIYASERLWKKKRKASVLTMIGLNIAYGMVVAHNYGLARGR